MPEAPAFVRPDLPQSTVRFVGQPTTRIAPTFNDIVAVPIVHDWGPLGSEENGTPLLTSFADFEALYGTSDSPGRTAVLGAFAGMNLPGRGGAGGVVAHRMATGSAARATLTITNTTPANALVLDARYAGDAGEQITAVVEDDPVDATKDRLRILFRGVQVEKFSYPAADITALVALITDRPSRYVTATQLITGVALTHTAGTALAGGDDGSALASAQWTAAMDALEFQQFGVFAPFNLTDGSIQAAILSWIQTQEEEMRPFVGVFGGAAGESVDTAVARSGSLEDPHVVNLGVGTFHDDLLDADLSTSQLAPRLAGVLAARGEEGALTRAPLAGLSVVGSTGASTAELVAARDGGVTALRRVSATEFDLAISQGVTTFTDRGVADRPYELFSEPRYIRIMDNFVRRMAQWGDEVSIGANRVTKDTRLLVEGKARSLIDDLVARALVTPGSGYVNAVETSDPSLEDTVPYEFGWHFTRTVNALIGKGRVS